MPCLQYSSRTYFLDHRTCLVCLYLFVFGRATTEWVAEKRELKEKHKRLEEAEEKVKEELLRVMVNSSQVGATIFG